MDFRPSVAGVWYPRDAEELGRLLEGYFAAVPGRPIAPAAVRALVVPHAGYQYSGGTAAFGYSLLSGRHPDEIVVIDPLHQHHPKPVLTSGYDAYVTPLGPVVIDRQLADRISQALVTTLGNGLHPLRDEGEHSIEVQLPFLQQVVGEFSFVPIMLADQSEAVARAVAEALTVAALGEGALVLASSDLSHFYPQSQAQVLDREMINRVVAMDPVQVLRAQRENAGFACGVGAIAAALWHAREAGADAAELLRYSTSGDTTGDYHSVVGYAAVCLYQAATPGGLAS